MNNPRLECQYDNKDMTKSDQPLEKLKKQSQFSNDGNETKFRKETEEIKNEIKR